MDGIKTKGKAIHLADLIVEAKSKMDDRVKWNGTSHLLIGSSGCGKSTLLKKVYIDNIFILLNPFFPNIFLI